MDMLLYGKTESDVWLAPFAGALGPSEASARWQLDEVYNAEWVGDQNGDGLQELVIEDAGLLLTLSPTP